MTKLAILVGVLAIISLINGTFSQEYYDDKSDNKVQNMSPSELLAAEKVDLESINYGNISTPIHIPFNTEYFSFNETDWKIVSIPLALQEVPQDQLMLMSNSHQFEKNLTIEFTPPKSVAFTVHYKYYISPEKNDSPSAELHVYLLMANDTRFHVSSEEPSVSWSNSSFEVDGTEIQMIEFVGILNHEGNELGLRNLFVKKSEDEIDVVNLIPVESDTTQLPTSTLADEGNSVDTITQDPNEIFQEKVNESLPEQVETTSSISSYNTTEGNDLLMGDYGTNMFEEGADEGNISEDDKGTHTSDDSQKQNSSAAFGSSTIKDNVSGSKGIANFFIVAIIAIAIIAIFIFWRRRRRREDEVPVFQRSSSEHGNSAYKDDEAELDNSGIPPSNYNSFK